MYLKRLVLAVFAFSVLLPLSGCGCHRHCCGASRSYAPPPQACCDKGVPAGYLPSVQPQ